MTRSTTNISAEYKTELCRSIVLHPTQPRKAVKRSIAHIKAILLQTKGVNELDNSMTPLTLAITYGHVDVVCALLSHPELDVNKCDKKTLLVQAGASVNETDRHGQTALFAACKLNQKSTIQVLLRHRADQYFTDLFGMTSMHLAIFHNHLQVVEQMLEYEDDPKYLLGIGDGHGDTALHMAAGRGHLSIVKMLVMYGADPGQTNSIGMTPYELARECDNLHVANWMQMQDASSWSSLHVAIDIGHTRYMKKLIRDFDVDIDDQRPRNQPMTPLQLAWSKCISTVDATELVTCNKILLILHAARIGKTWKPIQKIQFLWPIEWKKGAVAFLSVFQKWQDQNQNKQNDLDTSYTSLARLSKEIFLLILSFTSRKWFLAD